MKKEKKQRENETMVAKAKEKRDFWIGYKLGNVVTDVKIGGKDSKNEAFLIQSCKFPSFSLNSYPSKLFHRRFCELRFHSRPLGKCTNGFGRLS